MLDFMEFTRMFDFEEKLVLNRVALDMSKSRFLDHCAFSESVTTDDDCKSLMKVLLVKVEKLSDEEWDNLKSYLPFDVSVSDADLNE